MPFETNNHSILTTDLLLDYFDDIKEEAIEHLVYMNLLHIRNFEYFAGTVGPMLDSDTLMEQ